MKNVITFKLISVACGVQMCKHLKLKIKELKFHILSCPDTNPFRVEMTEVLTVRVLIQFL